MKEVLFIFYSNTKYFDVLHPNIRLYLRHGVKSNIGTEIGPPLSAAL